MNPNLALTIIKIRAQADFSVSSLTLYSNPNPRSTMRSHPQPKGYVTATKSCLCKIRTDETSKVELWKRNWELPSRRSQMEHWLDCPARQRRPPYHSCGKTALRRGSDMPVHAPCKWFSDIGTTIEWSIVTEFVWVVSDFKFKVRLWTHMLVLRKTRNCSLHRVVPVQWNANWNFIHLLLNVCQRPIVCMVNLTTSFAGGSSLRTKKVRC